MSDKYKNKNIYTIRCKTTILLYMYVQLHNHYLKDAVPIAKLFAWGEGDKFSHGGGVYVYYCST